jgi:hypothetical protein
VPIPAGRPTEVMDDKIDSIDVFEAFMSDDMLNKIVEYTNLKMVELRQSIGDGNRNSASYVPLDLVEFKAFLGCLIMTG